MSSSSPPRLCHCIGKSIGLASVGNRHTSRLIAVPHHVKILDKLVTVQLIKREKRPVAFFQDERFFYFSCCGILHRLIFPTQELRDDRMSGSPLITLSESPVVDPRSVCVPVTLVQRGAVSGGCADSVSPRRTQPTSQSDSRLSR